MSENILVSEYTLLEQAHLLGGFSRHLLRALPADPGHRLRTQATSLDVPVYLAQGATRPPVAPLPAQQWFDLLQAPSKSSSPSTPPATVPCGSNPPSSTT